MARTQGSQVLGIGISVGAVATLPSMNSERLMLEVSRSWLSGRASRMRSLPARSTKLIWPQQGIRV